MGEALLDAEVPEDLPQTFMPHPVKGLLEVNKVVEQVSLVLDVFLKQYSAMKNMFHHASSWSESGLLFCELFFCLLLESVQDDTQHDLTGVANEAYCSVILALTEVSFLWERDD